MRSRNILFSLLPRRKRLKVVPFQQLTKRRRSSPKEEEDLFQLLPDSLLEAILRKVGSIRSLLRCESVCKRWNRLCPFVDELVFDGEELPRGGLNTLIEHVLSSRKFTVRSLQVLNAGTFHGMRMPSWLTQLSAQLEFLKLEAGLFGGFDPDYCRVLPDKVCFQRLVHLSIEGLDLLEEEASSPMPCVTSCCNETFHERWVEKLVELSPMLKEMTVEGCNGDLCISSQSLERLVVDGDYAWCCLEVEAPRLSHLEIWDVEQIVVRGAQALHEFVLWSGERNYIDYCSMPRVSRWIFMDSWTCMETVHVLESAKGIEIGHVQLATPLICDTGVPLLNPTCTHLLQSLRELGISSFDADETEN